MHTERELNELSRIAYMDLASDYEYLCEKDGYKESGYTINDILTARSGEPDYQTYISKFQADNNMEISYNDAGEIDYITIGGVQVGSEELQTWKIVDIHDTNNTNGFYGCAVDTGEGDLVLTFRGSEAGAKGKTIDDWGINDVGLAIETPEKLTPQHEEAIRWANDLKRKGTFDEYNTISTTGHSLGGNLSEFLAMYFFSENFTEKFIQCTNLDGPGINKLMMEFFRGNYDTLDGKMHLYKASGVGTIFHKDARDYMNVDVIAGDPTKVDLSILPESLQEKLYQIVLHGQGTWIYGEDGNSFVRIEEGETMISCGEFLDCIDSLPLDVKMQIYDAIIKAADSFLMDNGEDSCTVNVLNVVLYVATIKNKVCDNLFSSILPLKDLIPEDVLNRLSNEFLILITDPLNNGLYIVETFISNCVEMGFLNPDAADYILNCFRNSKWYNARMDFNSRYGVGAQYSNENPCINVDTESLRKLASRIYYVNDRLINLDERLNNLYWRVGIRGLFNLIYADILTGYSWRLTRCQNYLNNTADSFDQAENNIINLFK